jgi:hypothetical protein
LPSKAQTYVRKSDNLAEKNKQILFKNKFGECVQFCFLYYN